MTTPATRPAGSAVPTGTAERRLVNTVARLAADDYTGRRVGTEGGRAAGGWLAEQLRSAGARVSSDQFPVAAVRELSASPVLGWAGRGWAHRRDFAEHLRSADLPTPSAGRLATSEDGDWHDRWVLAGDLAPEVVDRAAVQGAHGLLVARGVDEAGWMPKMIAGPPPIPVAVLSVRSALHAEMLQAARAGGGAVTASVPVRTITTTGTNIHGVLRDPIPGGLSVLLTAHYDGVGDDPGQRLPAAADNASGVAVVLEAARQLHDALPAGVGLAVALLDAEEVGALGSAHHAGQVAAGTCVLNIDGAAQLAGAAAVEAGGPAEALLAALDQAGRQTGVPLRAGPMPSDNRRYAAAGLPAVGIGMGMPGYQTPAETVDRVEPRTLLAATRLVVATVTALAGPANP